MRFVFLALAISLLVASYGLLLPSTAAPAASTPLDFTPVYTDSFETETNWLTNEEIITNCYTNSIGIISRTTDFAFDGSYSLLVWANQAHSIYSNHVIAGKSIVKRGQSGIWRYVAHAYIDPATANSGQTGPEISIQNTRSTPSGFRTSTAGIQYISNAAASDHDRWNVWYAISPTLAGWQTFVTQPITSGIWYTLTLEADYISNTYRSFALEGGELNVTYDLSAYHIAEEDKHFTNEDFVITLEAENRWHACGTSDKFEYKVYYDMVTLSRAPTVSLPIISRR